MFTFLKNIHYAKAKKKAQKEISYFIEFLVSHPDEKGDLFVYLVKSFFSEGNNIEHMWVQVFSYSDGVFVGRLANEPRLLSNLKINDVVKIKKEEVEDFVLLDKMVGVKTGGFSL
jgi:uncharacterized protein YegJ (DUF2314 family)